VDRTQHHTRYINARLDPRAREDVLLLKAFFKGIGSYGAEDTANGFSGYLTELLVLWKGSFGRVIEWLGSIPRTRTPPADMEELGRDHIGPGPAECIAFRDQNLLLDPPHPMTHYMSQFAKDALIIVDPTDRERNVASPVSAQTLAHTAECASRLIAAPSDAMFHPMSRRPHDLSSLPIGSLEGAMVLPLPEANPSRIASQLRKSMNHLCAALLREGFRGSSIRYIYAFKRSVQIDPAYLKSRATWSGDIDGNSVLFWIDVTPSMLESTYRHWGPPLEHRQTADFRERWKDRPVLEEGGRSYVELTRTSADPIEIAIDLWGTIGHGPDLADSMLRRYG
jgi:tRNA nucleotidyltransferase (CCA-adding enzyme)